MALLRSREAFPCCVLCVVCCVLHVWPAAEEAVLDDLDDEAGRLLLAHRRVEALPGGQVKHDTKHETTFNSPPERRNTRPRPSRLTVIYTGSFFKKSGGTHNSLEQLDGLSSEAGEAGVQHQRNQGNHRVHVGTVRREKEHPIRRLPGCLEASQTGCDSRE